jgi:hypothetical protein
MNFFKNKSASWLIPAGFFTMLVLIGIVAILRMNNGHFVYTLDDPYIHLALAENIFKGHYGVNLQEHSAPSSSIIWPFLLAPFAAFSWFELVPLAINILCGILTIAVFSRTLTFIFKDHSEKSNGIILPFALFGISFIICTNLVSLSFMGMEHVLQVLCTVAILSGVIEESETGFIPIFAIIALVLAPLVRYENAALSGCVVLYLFYRKHFRKAVIGFVLMGFALIGFTLFLYSMELGILPTSITVKSRTAWQSNKIIAVLKTVFANISSRQGAVLVLFVGILLKPAFSATRKQAVAAVTLITLLFHLIFGDAVFGRYTNYITAAAILSVLYVYSDTLSTFLSNSSRLLKIASVGIITLFIGAGFISEIGLTPLSSNNIYEQQYQMGRFVREYYRLPVAVNDLGLVSFENDAYVLDLWGLASKPAFEVRMKERLGLDAGDWMNEFADRNNVKFAMIYDAWFPRIPGDWERIAELRLGKMRNSPAESFVGFYSLDPTTKQETLKQLAVFKSTLPAGVELQIFE